MADADAWEGADVLGAVEAVDSPGLPTAKTLEPEVPAIIRSMMAQRIADGGRKSLSVMTSR
ncbi:hypothetical protein [Salinicola acroporae]|uniref:hypothetical protein n=1 Tax=Salinicola acroporae TaxID=1541440 RepID=UPI002456948F|nr:hypothetical protein [Salinicola acroporae]